MKENYRARNHMFILYPDDPSHMSALELIKQSYDYALILHDRDTTETGELKKAHYHCIIRCKNAIWRSALSTSLGIAENYIEQVRNQKNSMEYLIHYNDMDKTKYDASEVSGTMAKLLNKYLNDEEKSEGEKVSELIDFITGYQGQLSITEFARYCAMNGYWADYRRAGAIFNKMIDEHNGVGRVVLRESDTGRHYD